jgi:hypothetical protein
MNAQRDFREVIREEPYMRHLILEFCADEAHTVPEIAAKLGRPDYEAMFWVMGMRRYGWIRELKDATPDGYFQYQAVPAEARA